MDVGEVFFGKKNSKVTVSDLELVVFREDNNYTKGESFCIYKEFDLSKTMGGFLLRL
jgi:hypothetical protein